MGPAAAADGMVSWSLALERIVEGSPVLVLVVVFTAFMIWKTWRSERMELLQAFERERQDREAKWQTERKELLEQVRTVQDKFLTELREERDARVQIQKEMVSWGERSVQATLAVREALMDLRHAIEDKDRKG